MISKQDLERLLERPSNGKQIVSLFLDMSVNSNNKRTHNIFLNQRRAQFDELDSDRQNHHREAIGEVFARVGDWLDDGFDEENRGVVIYTEVGGPWFEALQFPVPVRNQFVMSPRPVVGPLAQVLESYDHHGVVLLDREHVRILSVYLGTLLDEFEVHKEPLPTSRDVQPGGFSQQRFQRRKREEIRHFFKEFADEVAGFVRRDRPDDLVILGTEQNVAKFMEFLPEEIRKKVIHTGAMEVDETTSEVLGKLRPHLDAHREMEAQAALQQLRERLDQDYLATAGYQSTLTALQEGKVDTLVMERDHTRDGVRCKSCGFVFARMLKSCTFCDSQEMEDVNASEEVVRMAEGQGANIEFVGPGVISDLRGVGSILRF